MYRLRTGKRRGGRVATAGSSQFGMFGANLSNAGYDVGEDYFINLMRVSSFGGTNISGSSSAYVNANGWLTNFPNGEVFETWIKLALRANYGYLKPGQYKITSSTGVTPSLGGGTGSGIVQNSSAPNLCTFTVTAQSNDIYASPNYDLRLRLTNSTGSTIATINDIAIFHVDEEAAHLAGKLFKPDFLARMANKSVIRFLDCTQANVNDGDAAGARYLVPADLPTEANRNWGFTVMPASLMGKLYNEIKAAYPASNPSIHVTTHAGCNRRRFNAVASTNTINVVDISGATIPHLLSNGQKVSFDGYNNTIGGGIAFATEYFVVNVGGGGTTFQISTTSGGAALDITSDLAPDYGRQVDQLDRDLLALYTAQIAQIFAVAPNANIIVEASNELWNSAFPQYHWTFSQGLRLSTGDQRLRGVAYLSLIAWKAALDAGYARNKVTFAMGQQAVFFGGVGDALDIVDSAGIISVGQATKNIMTSGGPGQVVTGPYIYPDTVDGGSGIGTAGLVAAGAASWTDGQWLTAMQNGVTYMAERCSAMRTQVLAKNAALQLSAYECGQHVAGDGGTGAAAVGTRFRQWLESSSALTWLQDYRQRVFINNEFINMTYYTLSGRWAVTFNANDPQQWGMRRATGSPDTPMSIYFDEVAAPVITSNGGGLTASVNAAENQTAVTTVTATDASPGAVLTYSIYGGADAAKFTINSSSGVLTFVSAPDFETPTDSGGNNVYDVVVKVSDGVFSDTQAIAVTVTDVSEGGGPTFDEGTDTGTQWFVRPNGGAYGTENGTSWTNAFDGFNDITWGSISAGDTIWVSGGTYTQDLIPTATVGSSSNPIKIRRARADSAQCVAGAGWNSAFDSTVIQTSGAGIAMGNSHSWYIISGAKVQTGGTDDVAASYGWRIDLSGVTSGNGIGWYGDGSNNTFRWLEVKGAGLINVTGDMRGVDMTPPGSPCTGNTISHCWVHDMESFAYCVNATTPIFEYCIVEDIAPLNTATFHPNGVITWGCPTGIVRYSTFRKGPNGSACGEGIFFEQAGGSENWKIYGNIFENIDYTGVKAIEVSCAAGALKVFNNTFVNCNATIFTSDTPSATGGEQKNNFLHATTLTTGLSGMTSSNNITAGSTAAFTNFATKNYRPVATVGAGFAKDAGVSLATEYNKDRDGNTRGADGTWDVGAYEKV